MKNLGVTNFVQRQLNVTQDSAFGGFIGPAATLLDILGSYPEDEAQAGFAPFVRIVEVHQNDLHWFLSTHRKAEEGEGIFVYFEARSPDETKVPTQYLVGAKNPPEAARVILYSREQLESEGEAEGLPDWVEWAVVSINMGPADESIPPFTMLRNWYATWHPDAPEAVGGSPHYKGMDNDEFIRRLYKSMLDWADTGRSVSKLPQ